MKKSNFELFQDFSKAYENLLDCLAKELGIYKLLDWIEGVIDKLIKSMFSLEDNMDKKYFEMIYNSKIDKHIEYLKDCWLNKKTITIKDAKYFVKEFTHREGIDFWVDICLVFKEFDLNAKNEDIEINEVKFKAGDKVKLNQPMHHSMEKQVPYKKYYDVVVTDTMYYGGNELQILGIDGVKELVSSEYFDLYNKKVELDKVDNCLTKKYVVVCPTCGNSDLKTEYGCFICKCGNYFYVSNCNIESID